MIDKKEEGFLTLKSLSIIITIVASILGFNAMIMTQIDKKLDGVYNQINNRMDRFDVRMDRIENVFLNSNDKRVSQKSEYNIKS